MSKEDVKTTVAELKTAIDKYQTSKHKDVSPEGAAERQLLSALGAAVVAIGDEIIRMGI